jgi:hypothetical protein
MCLCLVHQEFYPPLDERKAWKVFIRTSGGLRFPHYRMNGDYQPGEDVVEQEVWLSAVQKMARTIRGADYLTGFHAFTTVASAFAWSKRPSAVVVPVKMRKVRLEGLHAQERRHRDEPILKCWVADEMYVTKEIVNAQDPAYPAKSHLFP